MLSKELEEMLNENSLEYKLRELFRQAEKASRLAITDLHYVNFTLGYTKEVPMKFTICKFEDIENTQLANNIDHKKLTGKEFLEMLKTYDEKLSSLLSENFGSRYILKIYSEEDKYDKYFTRIYAVIEDTQK